MKKMICLFMVLLLLVPCLPIMAEEEETYIQKMGYTPKVDHLTIQTNNRVIAEGNLVDQFLEKQLGVQIDWLILGGNELSQKLTLLTASEELPDVITLPSGSNVSDYVSLRDQDLLVNLDEYLDKWGDNIKAARSEEQIEALREMDGNLYALNSNKETDFDMLCIRKDWLDKLNLEVPATTEDFLQVMRAFKNQDPDGNNQDDTYGYFAWASGSNIIAQFSIFWSAFNANPLQWVYGEDGSIIHGATRKNELINAVKYLNGMYNEGLINANFVTCDKQSYTDMAVTDKQGCTSTQFCYVDKTNQNSYLGSATRDWICLSGLYSAEGVGGGYLTRSNPKVRQYTCITVDSKDPDLAMLYLNLIADIDVYTFIRSGIEGEHYYIDDAGLIITKPEFVADNSLLINNGITATYAMPFLPEDPLARAYAPSTIAFRELRKSVEKPFYAAFYESVPEIVDEQLDVGMSDYITQQIYSMIMEPNLDAEAAVQAMIDKLYSDYHLAQQTEYANAYAEKVGLLKK